MSTIAEIKASLQQIHQGIEGVVSTPHALRKIEGPQLPCTFIRTGACAWDFDNTQELYQAERTFYVECMVSPVTQDLLNVNETLVDTLIERFGKAYRANFQVGAESFIRLDTLSDGGIQVIDLGILYIGFVFEFQVQIRRS